MNNFSNIGLGVLALAVGILYFLHFKSNGPSINTNPSSADITKAVSQGARVAFINTDTFFSHYNKYKALEKEMEGSQKAAQATIQNKMKALEQDYAKLMQQAQSGQITPQQAQAKEKEMVARKNALDQEGQNIMKTMGDKSTKATTELYDTMKKYFEANKTKYSCDYVMGYQSNGSMLYIDPKFDITKEVTADLNK